MMVAFQRFFALLVKPQTLVWLVLIDVLACLEALRSGALDPTLHVGVQLAFVCSWLVLLARAMDALLVPRPGAPRLQPALQYGGGLLSLAALAFYMGAGASGHVTLRPGQVTESYQAPAFGDSASRFLGFAFQELRWDGSAGTGSVVVKDLVKGPRKLQLRLGETVQVGAWRVLPVAQGEGTVPSGATLSWSQRGAESQGEIRLQVGDELALESIDGFVKLLSARADFNGQGPALKVETRLGEQGTPDRRWLLARAPEYDASGRHGPVVLRVKDLQRGGYVRLSLSSRRGIELAWLGLLLLLLGRLLALRSSVHEASRGVER